MSCNAFLEDIERRYNSGELRRLVDKLDVKEIATIRRFIGNKRQWDRQTFIGWAQSERDSVTFQYIINGYDKASAEDAQQLLDWLKGLQSKKEQISESISSILYSMGCQQQNIETLYKQTFGSMNTMSSPNHTQE